MNRQNTLKHLLLERVPAANAKTKYGSTNLQRSIATHKVCVILTNGDDKKLTKKLVDEVIVMVESGDDSIGHLLAGDAELIELLRSNSGSRKRESSS